MEAVREREAADAACWEATAQREIAEAERTIAIKQAEEAEAARWKAVREREAADAAHWEAAAQREIAEAGRTIAIKEAKEARAAILGAIGPPLSWNDCPHLEKQGLFIVGHARAGTSILLRALNTSPQVFLFGEASLYQGGLRVGFPRWYNAMHVSLGNARAKDSYCPPCPHEDANGVQALDWLSQRYRYVGEKLAFRSASLGYDPQRFFDFQAQYFRGSHYLCVIRNPSHVLQSSIEKFHPADLEMYRESYLANLSLIADMCDLFPNTLVLVHERVAARTFDVIGARLGLDLKDAFSLYEHDKFRRDDATGFPLPHEDLLSCAYSLMVQSFSETTLQIADLKSLRQVQHELAGMVRSMASPPDVPKAAHLPI